MPTIKLLKKKNNRVPTTAKRKYQDVYQDKRWKRMRAEKMRCNPVCERCENMKRTTPTAEVHHVVPFEWGRNPDEIERLSFDWHNLMSLCKECHTVVHEIMKKLKMKEQWLRLSV
jgi:5-methylcytosine-specific restriction protein A